MFASGISTIKETVPIIATETVTVIVMMTKPKMIMVLRVKMIPKANYILIVLNKWHAT